ncbi:30S ribosomal protein S7 [Candidatus Woesebacteria bacterium]|nr:30S ribosomal protein S7 [Candidatus Woesebacteria bacterium]
MPRHQYKRRAVKIDPVFDSFEIAKFINYIMLDGKKSVAQKVMYAVMEQLKSEENDSMVTLNKAINNVTPEREVRPRRLGGASYLVPTEVRKERRLHLALNWIIEAAEGRSNKEFPTFAQKLSTEIIEASKNQGQAVAKRQQAEKLADQNKAFAHLKW